MTTKPVYNLSKTFLLKKF